MSSIFNIRRLTVKSIFYIKILWNAFNPKKRTETSGRVLLVPGGHIGDAVMDASAWETLIGHYAKQGKDVYILSTRENWNYFQLVLNVSKVTYINRVAGDPYGTLPEALIKHATFDTIIARVHGDTQLYAQLAALHSNRKIVVAEQEMFSGKRKLIMKALYHRYSDVIVETLDMNERMTVEKLIQTMGIDGYKMRLLPIPEQLEAQVDRGHYITIAVDSQNPRRRWPLGKFIDLINCLLSTCTEDIYLTGNCLTEEELAKFNRAYKDNMRVKITIGRLSFLEWIELLRGASCHVGVDSGSIHIAATVGTKAICLSGVWQGHRFFPYDLQETAQVSIPVCVHAKHSDNWLCYGCATKKEFGYGNAVCMARCRNSQPCLCLSDISVEDVISAIEETRKLR